MMVTVAYPKRVPTGVRSTITSEIRSNRMPPMRPGQQEAMVENDGVGGNGVGKTSLILEGGSPKNNMNTSPEKK